MKGFIEVQETGALHCGQRAYIAVDDIRMVGQYWNWESEEAWTGTTEITLKDETRIHVWDSIGYIIAQVNDATSKHRSRLTTLDGISKLCRKCKKDKFDSTGHLACACSDECPFHEHGDCDLESVLSGYPEHWPLFILEDAIEKYEQNNYVSKHPQIDPEADEDEADAVLDKYPRERSRNLTQARIAYNSAYLREAIESLLRYGANDEEREVCKEAVEVLKKMEATLRVKSEYYTKKYGVSV